MTSGMHPQVGIGVIVRRQGKVLLGLRQGSHGAGSWAFSGGHLEFGESLEETARREVAEETGLRIENVLAVTFTNDIFIKENKHYVTLFVVADSVVGEPQVLEPEKCKQWQWFPWNDLPQPRFLALQNLLKQGFDPFSET
jgi:8-oxo-dGTP diphosphatase